MNFRLLFQKELMQLLEQLLVLPLVPLSLELVLSLVEFLDLLLVMLHPKWLMISLVIIWDTLVNHRSPIKLSLTIVTHFDDRHKNLISFFYVICLNKSFLKCICVLSFFQECWLLLVKVGSSWKFSLDHLLELLQRFLTLVVNSTWNSGNLVNPETGNSESSRIFRVVNLWNTVAISENRSQSSTWQSLQVCNQ